MLSKVSKVFKVQSNLEFMKHSIIA